MMCGRKSIYRRRKILRIMPRRQAMVCPVPEVRARESVTRTLDPAEPANTVRRQGKHLPYHTLIPFVTKYLLSKISLHPSIHTLNAHRPFFQQRYTYRKVLTHKHSPIRTPTSTTQQALPLPIYQALLYQIISCHIISTSSRLIKERKKASKAMRPSHASRQCK